MIFPFLSSIILYGAEDQYDTDNQYGADAYADSDQYGDDRPTAIPRGSDYGTGVYSEYNSDSGRYTATIEIAGYSSDTGTGYGAGGTDDRYNTGTDTGTTGGYGYTPEDTMHSYEDVVCEYEIDVLDGDAESGSGDAEIYIPVEISR